MLLVSTLAAWVSSTLPWRARAARHTSGQPRLRRAAVLTDGAARIRGRLRTMRASLSRTPPSLIYILANHVARQPPGALAERSGSERIAGCSGGASGPTRPGLKTYRKFSPGAPQAVDVALPRMVQLVRGPSASLQTPDLLVGQDCCGGQLRPKLTETLPSRAVPRAARRTAVPAGQRCGSGGIRTPGPSRDARFQVLPSLVRERPGTR